MKEMHLEKMKEMRTGGRRRLFRKVEGRGKAVSVEEKGAEGEEKERNRKIT